ncbi:type 1 glutamine amidotransferase [Microbacterium sp. YY-01]|uniref:type 1 glutamine amidotransferase n=1 Tax=Microbacterium sp. YY-01 TaxID=3421634 RepID=UPI003D17E0C4
MSTTMRITQLYPEQLGLTGDRGNVRALEVRLQRAGIAVQVTAIDQGTPIPEDTDIIVVGNGPLSALRGVLDDLYGRRDQLIHHVESGKPLLAMGAGAEALSGGIDLLDGSTVETLGVFPFRVERTRDRRVGYIIADTADGQIVGFEDHASTWHPDAGVQPYGAVTAGVGSFVRDGKRFETIQHHAAFATNVQGPVLPLNPQLSDVLLRAAAEQRGLSYETTAEHAALDSLAQGARSAIGTYVDREVFTYMQV